MSPFAPPDTASMWKRKNRDWPPEGVLAKQLAMNEQTWTALQEHGVTTETELRLDFFYVAPSRKSAERLAGFLRTETDYDVRSRHDSVTGTTQPRTVDLDVLNQWVEWMVGAGAEHGRCEFDGWGAEVPA
jgi:Regulator of ribonuclease activity B